MTVSDFRSAPNARPRPLLWFAAALATAGFAITGTGSAAGEVAAGYTEAGCASDTSVPGQLTVRCVPGAGAGQHAFIRCRDPLGIPHTHIGATIGAQGGWSTATCAPSEIAST
ncbi:hypothetical protein [Nocardia brasiliensis]|uniref:hypothetical protein n=1 Tax=Nocardia brasiliensis TaxID=37326 RepID=UPI0004A6BB7C|nr:hypothetical protein [Nocardia brasiliensis]